MHKFHHEFEWIIERYFWSYRRPVVFMREPGALLPTLSAWKRNSFVCETPQSSTSHVFFSQHIQAFSSPYHSSVCSSNPTIANVSLQVFVLCLTDSSFLQSALNYLGRCIVYAAVLHAHVCLWRKRLTGHTQFRSCQRSSAGKGRKCVQRIDTL